MSSKIMRTLDVNINRSSEGLRVLEDIARYNLEDQNLTKTAKILRHRIRKEINPLEDKHLFSRDADSDPGPAVGKEVQLEGKTTLSQLIQANSRRTQEALRSLEEHLRLIDPPGAKTAEECRYQTYTLEKLLLEREKKAVHLERLTEGIYGITASEFSGGRSNIESVKAMIDGGIRVIQYREKKLSGLMMYREAEELRKITADAGATFIMNDWTDIALAVDADGIHTGQDDLPFLNLKKIVPSHMVLGRSTHSPEQAKTALAEGADYLGVGPIFRTQTKENVCAPVGLEYLAYAVENVKIPFVAIGGIKRHNLPLVLEQGARMICLVTEITEAPDIPKRIAEINQIIRNHQGDQ